MNSIRFDYGVSNLIQGDFANAAQNFLESRIDPRILIRLFPDVLPENAKWIAPNAPPLAAYERQVFSKMISDPGRLQEVLKSMLIPFLYACRVPVSKNQVTEDETNIAEAVDTALLKLLVKTRNEEAFKFISMPNRCNHQVGDNILQSFEPESSMNAIQKPLITACHKCNAALSLMLPKPAPISLHTAINEVMQKITGTSKMSFSDMSHQMSYYHKHAEIERKFLCEMFNYANNELHHDFPLCLDCNRDIQRNFGCVLDEKISLFGMLSSYGQNLAPKQQQDLLELKALDQQMEQEEKELDNQLDVLQAEENQISTIVSELDQLEQSLAIEQHKFWDQSSNYRGELSNFENLR